LELHKVRTGEKKFGNKSKSNKSDNPFRSFRNSRDDRGSRYSRDDRRVESTTVTCADCGTECQVPFVPKTDRPVYCSDCFRQNKPQDSGNDRYSRDDRGSRYSRDRGSRYSRDRGSRSSRDDFRSKNSTKIKSLKKQETFYTGGSDKFYNTLKEKLFEILGGKVCSSCGFKDERALGFGHISDEDTFDDVRRGGFVSSWGKYISDPELARNELRILCLNCNELKKPISPPEKKTKDLKKKKNRFPR
jgi:CxxC-x17-CxxC domain-containing protein